MLCGSTRSGRIVPIECPRWAPPLLAVQFLTRLPVPWLARLTAEQAGVGLARAMAWLPPVGSLIGAATGATFVLAQGLWPPMIAATVALMVEAATLEPEVALRRFVENALSPTTVAQRPEIVERILTHRLATRQAPEAWAAQAGAGATFDAYERVPGITAPTLVQHGTEDVVVDPRNSELLVELLPDARLELFPGTGHLYFWEEPVRFVGSVASFLEEMP